MKNNNQHPFFSIITICYNSEKTIGRTLESILSQTSNNYEYLIIDGKSTDNTLNIIKDYENKFGGKLKWISEPDKGIYDAMNKGIRLSTGKIIGIVNSDDWLESTALENVYKATCENKSDNPLYLVCGDLRFHFFNGKTKIFEASIDKLEKNVKYLQTAGIRHPSTFVSRNVYEKIGVFDSNMIVSADVDFILRCYFNNCRFIIVNKILSNMSDGGISTSLNTKNFKRYYADRKIIFRRYTDSNVKYYIEMTRWTIKLLFKMFLQKVKII